MTQEDNTESYYLTQGENNNLDDNIDVNIWPFHLFFGTVYNIVNLLWYVVILWS